MAFKSTFTALDGLFKRLYQIDYQKEPEFYALRDSTDGIKNILYDMDALNAKSGALLTHISIVLVVLGLFLVKENHWVINLLLSIELIAYIFVATLLLRCLDIMGPPFRHPPQNEDERKKVYYFEVALRREIYARSLRIVYILTVLLIPVIFLKYVL